MTEPKRTKNADIILFQDETIQPIINIEDTIFKDEITGETTISIAMCNNKDVTEILHKTSNHHNMIITNPIFEGRALVGFVHPKTKQQFIKTTDFYKRKKCV